MANERLTERRIERLTFDSTGPARQIVWDSDITGFGVRLFESGRKGYVLQYGDKTRRRLMALGRVGSVTLDQARTLAKNSLFDVAQGLDPLDEKRRKREARADASTVDGLIEEFLGHHEARWSRSHYGESKRRLQGTDADKKTYRRDKGPRTTVSSVFGKRLASEVTRADINKLHARLTDSGSPVEANRVHTLLHTMFEWASDFGHLPEDHPNPARRRKGSSRGRNSEASRERYLTREEAPKLLEAADELGHGVIVRLWLLTGLRKSELLHRRWSDIDWKKQRLTVTETKNRKTHVVPLSDRAVALLKSLPRGVGKAPLFPGQGDKPRADFKRPWAAIRKKSGIDDLTVHDLRRTVGTWLTNLAGIPQPTVSALLNHTSVRNVTAIYTRPMESAVREAVAELERLLKGVEPNANDLPVISGEGAQ